MPTSIIYRFLKNKIALYIVSFLLFSIMPSFAAVQNSNHSVADLKNIPQDLNRFLPKNASDLLVSEEEAEAMHERFLNNFYLAWEHKKVSVSTSDVKAYFNRAKSERGYAENYLPWDNAKWEEMKKNAHLTTFPNAFQNAITIKTADIREMPTNSPRYEDPSNEGEGYPFDLFQFTTMPIGQPITVVHISLDKAWYYVQSAHISGWIEAHNVAFVDSNFVKRYKKVPLVAFVEDNISLLYKNRYIEKASIGTVLPYLNGKVHIPLVQAFTNTVHIVPVSVEKNSFTSLPMRLSSANIAKIANRMMGQSYGWGGVHNNRDCSSLMRDLFITFGVWLPRNSFAQSYIGQVELLKDMSNTQKINFIKNEAKPFLSFIYLPGHIGLYLGTYKNEPVFYHAVWGVRAKNEGRIIIGKTVITTLDPAKENSRADREQSFINRIIRLNTLGSE